MSSKGDTSHYAHGLLYGLRTCRLDPSCIVFGSHVVVMAARATPASVRVVTGIVCKSVCVAQDLFDSGHRDDVMVKYPLSVCREGLLGHYNPQPTLTQIMTNPLLSVTPIPPQIFRCRVVWLWFYGSVVEMTMNFVYRIVVAC